MNKNKEIENIKTFDYLCKNKETLDPAVFDKENLELENSLDFNDLIKNICFGQGETTKTESRFSYISDQVVNIENSMNITFKDKAQLKKNLEVDLLITSFKIKLGERFIFFFEDYGIINET